MLLAHISCLLYLEGLANCAYEHASRHTDARTSRPFFSEGKWFKVQAKVIVVGDVAV